MVDYSRFNNINIDSDDEDEKSRIKTTKINNNEPKSISSNETMSKKGKDGRIQFQHNGQTVYEWEQSLEEVNIFIYPPPQITRNLLVVEIQPHQLVVGIRNTAPFINEKLGGIIIPDESTWIFDDGEIQITLQKMKKGELWDCAMEGHNGAKIDSYTKEEVKKKIMLERFQEEHPGFDFSGAEFNGTVPNPRDFMGGVKYS